MEPEYTTKKELIDESGALEEQNSESERHEENSRQRLGNFGERTDRSFPFLR